MAYSGCSYNRFVSVWPPCAAMVTSLIVHRVWTWHLPWCARLVWLLKAQAKAKAHWLKQKMFPAQINSSWFLRMRWSFYLCFSIKYEGQCVIISCGIVKVWQKAAWAFNWGLRDMRNQTVSQHIPNESEVVFCLLYWLHPSSFPSHWA